MISRSGSHPAEVGLRDIIAAARRIAPVAAVTPLVELSPMLHIKAESLQVTGSFKLRGAYNALAAEAELGNLRGVVCHSSGNHAQGVARAARLLGVESVAVMPDGAPAVKRDRVVRDGAEVVEVGNDSEERVRVARAFAAERGLLLLSSTENLHVIAGQGTVGLELVASLLATIGPRATGESCAGDGVRVLVPVGGGGLASGVAVAVKALLPQACVVGVEPAFAADARASLQAGAIVRWPVERVTQSMADGLRHTSVGPLAFAHLQRYLDRVVTVTEADIERAMWTLAAAARMVVEPSGAVSLAAHLSGAAGEPARRTVCIASGGNVDLRAFARAIGSGAVTGALA